MTEKELEEKTGMFISPCIDSTVLLFFSDISKIIYIYIITIIYLFFNLLHILRFKILSKLALLNLISHLVYTTEDRYKPLAK